MVGQKRIVHMLLNNGADVNAHGDNGTALFAASAKGNEQVVQILFDNGADIHGQGELHSFLHDDVSGNALYAASTIGHPTIVQILLDRERLSMLKLDTMAMFYRLHLSKDTKMWSRYCWKMELLCTLKA
jgi:ankyrin repeat protein